MAYYEREEQETLYNYDAVKDNWRVYSTYPPHIKRLLEYADVIKQSTDEDGRIIAVEGYCDKNQVRLFRPR